MPVPLIVAYSWRGIGKDASECEEEGEAEGDGRLTAEARRGCAE